MSASANMSRLLSNRFRRDAGPAIQLSLTQAVHVADISARLRDGRYHLLATPCPCGIQGADVEIAQVDRYGLPLRTVLCLACGTLRTDPYLDEPSLTDFYARAYQEMYGRANDQAMYFEKQQAYGRRILAYIRAWLPSEATVFEIGCGAGGALSVVQEAGYRVSGCDHSRELIQYGISRGLPLHWGDPAKALRETPAPSLLVMHHVFEHIRDPVTQLVAIGARLARQGAILLVLPDIARADRFPFPAGDLRLFLHIAHRFNFSREGLRRLTGQAHFHLTDLQEREAHGSPEFWALLRELPTDQSLAKDPNAGDRMLEYLRRTERLRAFGLTRGQLITLPGRVRAKLVRALPSTARQFARRVMSGLR